MPNHIHGILFIENHAIKSSESPKNQFQKIIPGSIGTIIRGYKIGVTKWCRTHTDIYQPWQRNYYERIIRDENELNITREYIINNPENWKDDELFTI